MLLALDNHRGFLAMGGSFTPIIPDFAAAHGLQMRMLCEQRVYYARHARRATRAAEDVMRKHMADILHTARLRLRPLTLDDLDDMCAIWSDLETMRYYPAPYSRARVAALLRFCLDR
jgi:RimJ/RimL family protein N-acetyltransferase